MLNEDKSRSAAETRNSREETEAMRIASALSSGYDLVYCVDPETGRYEEYIAAGRGALKRSRLGEGFFADVRQMVDEKVLPEDRIRVALSLGKEALLHRLDAHSPFIMTYRRVDPEGDGFRFHILKAAWAEDGGGKRLVMGIADVDDRLRESRGGASELLGHLDFSVIARTLMSDCICIYCVDMETDRFLEYSAEEDYRSMGIQSRGEDFFGLSRRNAAKVAAPEDVARFTLLFTKENVIREIADDGLYSLTYQLMLDGKPTYVTMKIVRMGGENDRYVVIGVSNVDARIRREMAQASALIAAKEAAGRDALTGIRNKNAYAAEENRWNERIAKGEVTEMAVAVCDLNGLKLTNDTLGHKEGDNLLKAATAAICNTFRHSPVFRIGGDEFVAILVGGDFENREALVERFRRENKARSDADEGGVVVACGYADLRPGVDTRLEEVFDRADAAMYENKRQLKGARL